MDIPKPRRILLILLAALALYGAALPLWMSSRVAYARGTTKVATGLFPLLGVEGEVIAEGGRWISLKYTLPYARTGGWGQVQQRLLDFSDLPLAFAVSVALPILRWRRRAIAALVSCLGVLLCHVGLILWTAFMLSVRLSDISIPSQKLEAALYRTAEQATAYGNVSTIMTLTLVAIITALLYPRGCDSRQPNRLALPTRGVSTPQ